MALLRKPAVSLALSLFATALALGSALATLALGQGAPRLGALAVLSGSPDSAAHTVRASGSAPSCSPRWRSTGRTSFRSLFGLATLVYLWRANARSARRTAIDPSRPGSCLNSVASEISAFSLEGGSAMIHTR